MRVWQVLAVLLFLGGAGPAAPHAFGEELPLNADEIVVPMNIPLLDFIRFARIDHRLVLDRMEKGDRHHVGTMTEPLTRAALTAGEINPRPTARLVWDMAQEMEASARADFLEEQAYALRQTLAGLRANPETAQIDLDTVEALLALVVLWQTNPMDGAGS